MSVYAPAWFMVRLGWICFESRSSVLGFCELFGPESEVCLNEKNLPSVSVQLAGSSGAHVRFPHIRSPPFIHMLAEPGHLRKRLALSFLDRNFSSTHDPAGC
jgi:hypothetical protein